MLVWIVLLGCAREEAPCQERWWGRDADGDGLAARLDLASCEAPGDGWVREQEDCDDADPAVRGPYETRWYEDEDGDGYGYDGRIARGCEQPDGYVAAAGDCDRRDPDVHPGADDPCQYDAVDVAASALATVTWGPYPSESLTEAVVADFDGDGADDLALGTTRRSSWLFLGGPGL